MPGVIVFGELAGDGLNAASLEALTAGALLSAQLGVPLIGALLGVNARAAADGFQRGAERVLLCEGDELRQFDGECFAACAHRLVMQAAARIVLAPHTIQTREWMPRLAARMDAGLVMDCTAVAAQGDALLVTRPIFGGSVVGDFTLRGTPVMATLSPGAFAPAASAVPCAVEAIALSSVADSGITLLEEIAADTGDGVRLQDAKIVVSGGRGVGGPENWHYIEKAARDLGAAIGCSRPVVDAGWVASHHQVGIERHQRRAGNLHCSRHLGRGAPLGRHCRCAYGGRYQHGRRCGNIPPRELRRGRRLPGSVAGVRRAGT